MAMSKTTKWIIIGGAAVVAAWLAWKWYSGKQSTPAGVASGNVGIGGTGLGTNLNSTLPELSANSGSPDTSGLSYYAAPTNINITEPATSSSSPSTASSTSSKAVTT